MSLRIVLDPSAMSNASILKGVYAAKDSMGCAFRDLRELERSAERATDVANLVQYQNLLDTERKLFHAYRAEALRRGLINQQGE